MYKKKKNKFNLIIILTLFSLIILIGFNNNLIKANQTNESRNAITNERASNDEVSDEIKIIDFNQLVDHPVESNSKIIILFDGFSAYLRLKDGNNDMSKLKTFKFPFRDSNRFQKRKFDKDFNLHRGAFHGTHYKKGFKDHMLFYTDNPSQDDDGNKIEPGQYSGKVKFEYVQKRLDHIFDHDLYLFYLKFDNENTNVQQYIDEEIPSREELLKNIRLTITAKIPEEKIKQEEMLNKLMEDHKKIVGYITSDGQKHELKDDFDIKELPTGEEFKLVLKLTNPTKVKTKEGKDQILDYQVKVLFVDTKTPFKEEITNEANQRIEEIKNLQLSENDKKELVEEINSKLNEAIEKINSPEVKHRQLDTNPFKGSETQKEEAKKLALAFKEEIKSPILKTANTNLAIAKVIDAANKKIDLIKNDDTLTDGEKDKLILKVKEALEKSKQNLKDQENKEGLKTETASDIDTINNIKIEEKEKVKNLSSDKLDALEKSKKEQINSDKSLTKSEKNKLLEKVEEKIKEAKENVKKASKKADITQIENDLEKALSGINHVGTKKKDEAKANIDQYFEQQKTTINQNNNFTTDEKRELIEKIQQEVNKAKNTIEETPINDVNPQPSDPKLNDLLEEGKRSVGNVITTNSATVKKQAVDEIEEKKEELSEKINNLPTTKKISEEDKEYYKEKTKDIVDTDINNIKNKDLSNADVSNKKELAKSKLEAANKIIDALVEKTNEINNTKELSANEKTNEIKKIRQIAEEQLDKIKDAQSRDQVDVAQTVSDINNHKVTPLEKQKIIDEIKSEKEKK